MWALLNIFFEEILKFRDAIIFIMLTIAIDCEIACSIKRVILIKF